MILPRSPSNCWQTMIRAIWVSYPIDLINDDNKKAGWMNHPSFGKFWWVNDPRYQLD